MVLFHPLSDRKTSVALRFSGEQNSTYKSQSELQADQLKLHAPLVVNNLRGFYVENTIKLTSRQAREIKPAMIKRPLSKSLAALHGRTL